MSSKVSIISTFPLWIILSKQKGSSLVIIYLVPKQLPMMKNLIQMETKNDLNSIFTLKHYFYTPLDILAETYFDVSLKNWPTDLSFLHFSAPINK